ncbi:MAG: hypothetical protein IRZ16_18230 [Myxococcaceae bacterium]|nr:hypothetical protein [Myxococcaceae bacterium]
MNRALCAGILAAAIAAGSGCGGTWSNEDIVFLYALPKKEALRANVPGADQTASTQNGLQSRKDPLAVGDASRAYAETKLKAQELNSSLLTILEVVEYVRRQSPSQRGEDFRQWGPWADEKDRTQQIRLVIRRFLTAPVHYEWSIDVKRRTEPEDAWLQAIHGSYEPTDDVRRGSGTFSLDAARVREAGFMGATDDGQLQYLEVNYQTGGDPIAVELLLDAKRAHLEYEYEEHSDGSGRLSFDLSANWIPTGSALETLWVTSAWAASGAGRADYHVYGGNTPGGAVDKATALAAGEECWDESFRTAYYHEVFDSDGDGTPGTVHGLVTHCAVPDPDLQ